MGKENKGIQVFLRLRPVKKPFQGFSIDEEDNNKVQFFFPKDSQRGIVNNQDQSFNFKFNGVLGMESKQDEVFNMIAKDVIDSSFQGYNGTIFAYGQTGSGKTFTITGGAERYVDRGLIPRTVSYIFQQMREKTDYSYKLNISYLEIYNDKGYDLLDENHATKALFDLPKVEIFENGNDQFMIKNLSVHRAENEEDALNLLFIGDTNRAVSETPQNDASTRSHCIFMIMLEAQKNGEDVKTVSKLHLVDLSGSERVMKSGIEGQILKEAKFINLSLHYLQQVIVCLNKKGKGEQVHIPYRNSMMTMLLRDSIGGNCKTVMIATISPKQEDMLESLGTCRFAKGVMKIQNKVEKNERADPGVVIQRLKKEIIELKAEICMIKGETTRDHLDPEDIDRCNKMVEDFADSNDPGKNIVFKDRLQINQCFYHFKHLLHNQKKSGGGSSSVVPQLNQGNVDSGPMKEEISRLRILIQQRDNEIAILLSHLNKKRAAGDGPPDMKLSNNGDNKENQAEKGQTLFKAMMFGNQSETTKTSNNMDVVQKSLGQTPQQHQEEYKMNSSQKASNITKELLISPVHLTSEDLADRTRSFEIFRKSYRKNEAMEENREILKEKYGQGKQLGSDVNDARNQIKGITNKIEQIRRENAMRGNIDENDEIIKTEEEIQLQDTISILKVDCQKKFNQLKEVKQEIDRIQQMLEQCRVRMQKDFERWLSVMMQQQQQPQRPEQSTTTNVTDKNVTDNLEAFYKARDELYGLK